MWGIVLAEDQDLGIGTVTANQPRSLKAVHLRHAHVHNDDVRLEFLGFFYRFQSVDGFTGHIKVFPRLQKRAKSRSEYFVVVNNQNAYSIHPSPVLGTDCNAGLRAHLHPRKDRQNLEP